MTGTADARDAMALTVHTGDLLASDAAALVCPTNTAGPMGAGLARAFAARFPGLERDYRAACDRGEVQLGRVWRWATLLPPTVLCLPTKGHYRERSRRGDIDRGLADLTARVREWEIGSLAVPALGCGFGGLAWRQVAPLLHRHLAPLLIPVQIYAPQDAPADQATVAFLTDPPPAPARPPQAVRCRRSIPGRVAYVGRPGPLGNPYRLVDPRDPAARRDCLRRYRRYLYQRATDDGGFRAELEAVRGLDLGCYCAPRPCHADVILAWLLHHPTAGDRPAERLASALTPPIGAPGVGERLAVVGSVSFADPHALKIARLVILDELLRVEPAVVVSGGAKGIDTLAGRLASELGYHQADGTLVVHYPVRVPNPPPGMSRFEAGGYRARDQLVADDCTCLLRLACRHTSTYGSGWTADEAARQGKPVRQVQL
jgi:O-acetyl-ADP-ribose deacetylase (regulator of RNase III)